MEQFVVITGNPVGGFEYYGPVPESSIRLETYTQRLQDIGEDWWQAPLQALPNIVEQPAAPVGSTAVPGVHITVHTAGSNGRSHVALIDRELIEVVDENPDGTPDWENGSICDPVRGEEDFFYPAVALLRFLDSSAHHTPTWHWIDRQRVEQALGTHAEHHLIVGWQQHPPSGGYAIRTHGTQPEVVLHTPMEADAFTAGVNSAEQRHADPRPLPA